MKRKYTRNIEKLRRTQGCLTDCVAFVLNIHPQNVPYFVYPRKGWNERMKKFFKKHGYDAKWTLYCDIKEKKVLRIVIGDSLIWKTSAHAVVYRGNELVYDPQFPSKWKGTRATHFLYLKKRIRPIKGINEK